jgi:hypothetical protein
MPFVDSIAKVFAWYVARNISSSRKNDLAFVITPALALSNIFLNLWTVSYKVFATVEQALGITGRHASTCSRAHTIGSDGIDYGFLKLFKNAPSCSVLTKPVSEFMFETAGVVLVYEDTATVPGTP